MSKQPTYWDFGYDEYIYLLMAYRLGIRRNAMVGQCQHIIEYFLKHLLSKHLLNNLDVMYEHNLRALYEAVVNAGIDITQVRTQVMNLNNFYFHTRYPGRDAYLATTEDIDQAVKNVVDVYNRVKELL